MNVLNFGLGDVVTGPEGHFCGRQETLVLRGETKARPPMAPPAPPRPHSVSLWLRRLLPPSRESRPRQERSPLFQAGLSCLVHRAPITAPLTGPAEGCHYSNHSS